MKKVVFILVIIGIALIGCSQSKVSYLQLKDQAENFDREDSNLKRCLPGECAPKDTVVYVWEEPMVDIVDVPAGLDPEGIYYRPAHKEAVEIRQGRWRYVK